MKNFLDALLDMLKNFGTSVLEAIVVLLLGIIVIRLVTKLLRSIFNRTKIEGTAVSFIVSIAKALLALIIFFIILRIFNIETTGIIAIIAASGLAVGLALQDSISNLAGGVILLFTKPFKENDHIIIGSVEGKIRKIKLTTIEILTFDNIVITVPNNKVVTSEIQNMSSRSTRRISLAIPSSYKNDTEKVKVALLSIISDDERILSTPQPAVEISSLKDYHIEFKVKFWVNREDYWSIYNNFNEKVLLKFKENGLTLPFNRLYEKKEAGND